MRWSLAEGSIVDSIRAFLFVDEVGHYWSIP
jgi:hypothetical protein